MRLTKQTNYAVRTLMYCAVNYPDLSRISDIAKAYSISELFLFKLIKPLVDAGLLQTIRGRNGGVKLARAAETISLLEAIKLTEDSFALSECFEGAETSCPLVNNCDFNRALHAALQAFFDSLGAVTVADLVSQRVSMRQRLGLGEI